MYKQSYKSGLNYLELQHTRQRDLLNVQKQRRRGAHDEYRQLIEIIASKAKAIKEQHQQYLYKKHKIQLFKDINLSLQLSEWLRVCPENLDDWLLVPCPRAQRCLVVACKAQTVVYNKCGRCFNIFRSQLPGDGIEHKSMCILDCFYSQTEDTFYVLDVLSYGNQILIGCEAQFRFFWLRSRFAENQDLEHRNERNQKPFKLLKTYDFEDATSINMALQLYPYWCDNKPVLDGFLFYHKEASYTCGTTPLVGWLFPFMVRDVLGLNVSQGYKTPADYVTPEQYIKAFDEQVALKKQRWKHKGGLKAMQAEYSEAVNMEVQAVENGVDEEFDMLQHILNEERRLELGEEDEETIVGTAAAELLFNIND